MTTFKRGGLRFWRIGPVGGSVYGVDWQEVAVGFFAALPTLIWLVWGAS